MPTSDSRGGDASPPLRRFVVHSWEWELAGCTFVELHGDGRARILDGDFETREQPGGSTVMVPVFRLSELRVDDATVVALSALIEASGFRALPDRHGEDGGSDRLSREFLLEDASGVKRIHCDGEVPTALHAIETFIRDEILLPRGEERAAAPSLTRDQAEPLCRSVLPAA